MDYSSVGERYGEEFLEELNPPNRGKSGGRLLAGALSSFSAGRNTRTSSAHANMSVDNKTAEEVKMH
eukprot:scaffold41847_cov200-Skeletonema_dohrnii-CCMP3373.AAC.1